VRLLEYGTFFLSPIERTRCGLGRLSSDHPFPCPSRTCNDALNSPIRENSAAPRATVPCLFGLSGEDSNPVGPRTTVFFTVLGIIFRSFRLR